MNEPNDSQEVKTARLEEKVDALIKSVDVMTKTLDNLRTSFVPRAEFDQLSVLVKGIAGSGGMVKIQEKLENKVNRYALILGIVWFVFTALTVAGWQYFLATRSIPTSVTNNVSK